MAATMSAVDSNREQRTPRFAVRFLQDQQSLWTSPTQFRPQQWRYVGTLALTTAAFTQADESIERHMSPANAHIGVRLSDAGMATALGTASGFYLAGAIRNNAHARETGILASEAAVNALAVNSAFQFSLGRARPDQPGSGDFFKSGTSFPSNHSAMTWAVATVFAHEYPGWGTKLLSYGMASAVSAGRVVGRKHFTSDVIVGSALGWFVGQQIYNKRHDPSLAGVSTQQREQSYEQVKNPMYAGSSYVPLDSWVYAAFDRLAALGYISSNFQGMRPWTRTECARLLKTSAVSFREHRQSDSLLNSLRAEFETETRILDGERNLQVGVDGVYSRFLVISGPPLTDGFHFGKTIVNDFGRPYQEGFNTVSGFSSHAEAGPLVFYVRGEYQHSPSASAQSSSVLNAIAQAESLPVVPSTPFEQVNRFRLLDSYVAMNMHGWQASFGKQSLWWGPDGGGDMMLSNQPEPIPMLRLTNIKPFQLPGVFRFLGAIRSDTFIGQLDGYHFIRLGKTFDLHGSYASYIDPQPYLWGQKLSLQLTPNLQIGVSMTSIFAGEGIPLTFGTFFHTFSSSGNAQDKEPGDRRTGFDFTYRVPGLRKWLVLYNGSMSEDEPNPIAYPRRSAMNPGIYLPQLPKLRNMDLRVEAGYTNLPNDPRYASFYTNKHYAGGYTNNGQIMGSWLGPEARGYQVSTTYWYSGQNKLQVGYRKQRVDPSYIGGGYVQDFNSRYDLMLRKSVSMSTAVQYEQWHFPVLDARSRSNLAVSVQFTYLPSFKSGRTH